MYLYRALLEKQSNSLPVNAGLIGAGKFGAMFLSQVPSTPGLEVPVICDLAPDAARIRCREVHWENSRIKATKFTDDAEALISDESIDVVIEATGDPLAGIRHATACIEAGKHVVMVNVEADVLAGPYLAERAAQAGVVYSMAYGDQPALTMEMIDWARSCGFEVVAAGKGTKYLPHFHQSTPDTVWDHYGLTREQAEAAGMRSQMFNSFLDGTKSAIEMAAISNASGLAAPEHGLAFPPCASDQLAEVLRPREVGGVLDVNGQVEVVSSHNRDGSEVRNDLRWGVYCVFKAPNEYSANCFKQYGMNTDKSGHYSAMFKPFHLIGLELNISVLSAAMLGKPTGNPVGFNSDVVAVAKRRIGKSEMLDGEGGFCVWGKLIRASDSTREGYLPIGLATGVCTNREIAEGEPLRLSDVEVSVKNEAWHARERMLERFC